MKHTKAQGEVNDEDGQVPKPAYMWVHQVANDTDPLMWWKQHSGHTYDQTVPDCDCQLWVSWETLYQCRTCKEWLAEHTNIYSVDCRLPVPTSYLEKFTNYQPTVDKYLYS
jgi:hypothetical protein